MTNRNDYKLIIFDIDGTLADRETSELLGGVQKWFQYCSPQYKIAFATNQGGVGLQYWMKQGGFGAPNMYPTEAAVYRHIMDVLIALPCVFPEEALANQTHICFAYQSKQGGRWGPVPEPDKPIAQLWRPANRKPAPGMLIQAMNNAKIGQEETLMVGDRHEDKEAAKRAGVDFVWADTFFHRNRTQGFTLFQSQRWNSAHKVQN